MPKTRIGGYKFSSHLSEAQSQEQMQAVVNSTA